MKFHKVAEDELKSLSKNDINNDHSLYVLLNVVYRCEPESHLERVVSERVMRRSVNPSLYISTQIEGGDIDTIIGDIPFGLRTYRLIERPTTQLWCIGDIPCLTEILLDRRGLYSKSYNYIAHNINDDTPIPEGYRLCGDEELLIFYLLRYSSTLHSEDHDVRVNEILELAIEADRLDKLDEIIDNA
jgi:hypothetical protein